MSPSICHCPFCNSRFALGDPSPAQRITCPRCGESFAWRPASEDTEQGVALEEPGSADANLLLSSNAPVTAAQPRFSNRTVALLVLALMSVMAGIGLVFMVQTQQVRRGYDRMKPPKYEVISIPLAGRIVLSVYMLGLAYFILRGSRSGEGSARPSSELPVLRTAMGALLVLLALVLPFLLTTRPEPRSPDDDLLPVQAVPPAELAGLGYLPADVQVVAGVHVAAALQTESGRKLVKQLRLGPGDLSVEVLADWLGLRPDEIDHIVLGLKPALQLYVVIQTRRPYDRERVTHFKKLDVREHPQAAPSLPLYQCNIRPFLEPTILCAHERTLLLFENVDPKVIAKLQVPAPSGSDHLAAPLRDFLREENGLASGAQLWFAARGESLSNPLIQLLAPFKNPALFKKIESFGAWARLTDSEIQLTSEVNCSDTETASAVAGLLAKRAGTDEVGRQDKSVYWKRTTKAESLQEDLKGLRLDAGK
jgi:hypothetical protein